jgi:hypothetical protein
MIPNFIIPSEYEMLMRWKNAGVGGSLNCNAKSFIQDKKLKIVWDSKQMPHTEVFLLSGKWQSYQRFSRDRSWSENCTGRIISKIIMINISQTLVGKEAECFFLL